MLKKLDWDSDYFGMNIADLKLDKNCLDLSFVDEFAVKNNIELVQTCCDIAETGQINLLEKSGFNFSDLRVTYSLDLDRVKPKQSKSLLAEKTDIPVLKKIAGEIFTDSRYLHKKFDKNKVNDFYKVWVEKAVCGTFDDFCLKMVENNAIVGFISGKFSEGDVARIGVVGADKASQGKGIGNKLMASFFNHCAKNKIKTILVSTQGKNIRANNYYIRNNFGLKSLESWYYKFY